MRIVCVIACSCLYYMEVKLCIFLVSLSLSLAVDKDIYLGSR